ncbi:hypothetical protein JTB14_020157 [Gonioctena quinquepunctata]|nr:hypothetical protein JTB14_020157 [Gonioctena quinquepunctata]
MTTLPNHMCIRPVSTDHCITTESEVKPLSKLSFREEHDICVMCILSMPLVALEGPFDRVEENYQLALLVRGILDTLIQIIFGIATSCSQLSLKFSQVYDYCVGHRTRQTHSGIP